MLLHVQHIDKSFGGEPVLIDLSLELSSSETLSILGRSGCGKTTLLKTIAGIYRADEGMVLLNGDDLHRMVPHRRNVVYLYQETLLFPHMNVFENIAFGLRVRNVDKAKVKARTNGMIESLGLGGKENRMPHQLSGGQQQRVAFGRALIINPEVLLLDEPFGNLDVSTRSTMHRLFKRVAEEYRISSLFVTHDLKEAMLMGDRIALMDGGRLNVYHSREEFVADSKSGGEEEIEFWNSLK